MAGTSQSQEISVRRSTDLAQLGELEQILTGMKEPPRLVDDPEEIQKEILAQLLAAESDEELEQVGAAIGWRELEGVPMELHGFKWRPSAFDEGAPVFFVVSATRMDDGSRVVLTTGSQNVLAQLVNMAKRGTLVGSVRRLVKSPKPTASGYYPLWLETPEEIAKARKANGDRERQGEQAKATA